MVRKLRPRSRLMEQEMSSEQHTPTPWAVGQNTRKQWNVYGINGQEDVTPVLVEFCWQMKESDCRRIVACVNALAGMDPAAVGSLVEACRMLVKSEQTSNSLVHFVECASWIKRALAALQPEGGGE